LDNNNLNISDERYEKLKQALRVKFTLDGTTLTAEVVKQMKKLYFSQQAKVGTLNTQSERDFDYIREVENETPEGLKIIAQVERQLITTILLSGTLGDDDV
jgi:hypothetical protein